MKTSAFCCLCSREKKLYSRRFFKKKNEIEQKTHQFGGAGDNISFKFHLQVDLEGEN
jgi:hypothetical protein